MKFRQYLELQLFADDPTPEEPTPQKPSPAEPAEPNPTEPKPSEPKPQAKYTDDDVDKILGQKFAKWQKEKDKELTEAQKLANMDAQQKAEYKAEQIEKELNALKEKGTLADMAKTARKMLSDEEINISDDLLDMMVCTDAEKMKSAVDSFAKTFKEAVQEAVKVALKGPAPKAGTGRTTVTKEQILAIKNPSERQQMIAENIALFQ